MKKCPNCRREIEENSTFCEYCGHQIKRSKKGLWIALAAGAVVTVAVILVISLSGRSNSVVTKHFYDSKKYYALIEDLIDDASTCDELENAADDLEDRILDDVWDLDEITEKEKDQLKKIADDLTKKVKKKADKMGCDVYIDGWDYWSSDNDDLDSGTDWDSDSGW